MQKSTRSGLRARIGVAALGVGILSVVGSGVAFADETIDVSVEIEPNAVPGSLSLTVAADATTLEEGDPTATDRLFTGALPTVTVTDTRPAGAITDPAVEWYVMGTVTDFAGDADQPDIVSTEAFGWEPVRLTDDDSVQPGMPVQPGDGGFGAEELLYEQQTPDAPSAPGSWSANAKLTLQTPLDVEPGSYGATLTLSLFEDNGE